MLFTLELDDKCLCFRLQKDGEWRDCTRDHTVLKPTDFTTPSPSEIMGKSSRRGQMTINGRVYDVDPGVWPSEHDPLHHSSSVFRKDYPGEPTQIQLRQVIAGGDDSHHNSLVLNVTGLFELRQSPPFDHLINDPTMVVRHETFVRGNGYVGRAAARHDRLIDDLYESSMEYWKNHLLNHSTQEYSDTPSTESMDQVRKALADIRMNWKPDY